MFEAIVSKIANVVRNSIRAAGALTRRATWVTAATILALFLVW